MTSLKDSLEQAFRKWANSSGVGPFDEFYDSDGYIKELISYLEENEPQSPGKEKAVYRRAITHTIIFLRGETK